MADPYVGALRSLGEGAAFGWGDEAEALARSAFGPQTYQQNLGKINKEQKQYKEEHPYVSAGLEFAGSVPSMFIPGFGEARATQLATQFGTQVGLGALGGAGSSESGSRAEGAKEGAKEGALWGVGIPAAQGAYKGARWLMQNPEARLAEKVSGRKYKNSQGMRYESSPERQEWIGKAHAAGANAYDTDNPAYKETIFKAYQKQFPHIVKQANAKNYDELMKASYEQMARENTAQFRGIPNKMDWWGPEQYMEKDYLARAKQMGMKPAELMRQELRAGKPMAVYKDTTSPHPFLGKVDPATGANENELFRATHDYFGHLAPKKPNTFGPKGEENAWISHSQMYSDLAKPAMTAETRGQNSWVNYVNEQNKALRAQGKPTSEYAPNKPVLLPPEALNPKYRGGIPDYLKGFIE